MDKPEEITFAWLLLTGVTITFVLALAVVLFVIFYQRRLYAKHNQVEALKANRKREQLEAALNAQERERARIAKDLHDEVGATLSTAKLLLTNLPEQESDIHQNIQALVTRSIANLRSISHNLLPANLQDFGLVKTLEGHFNTINESSGIAAQLAHRVGQRLPELIEVQVYRIVQELLNNTLKHSGATTINLWLETKEEQVLLRYEDNGKGFEMSAEKAHVGLGLRNLDNRVDMLAGTSKTISAAGKGFTYELNFPIDNTLTNNETWIRLE